jgi:hypothetical protein
MAEQITSYDTRLYVEKCKIRKIYRWIAMDLMYFANPPGTLYTPPSPCSRQFLFLSRLRVLCFVQPVDSQLVSGVLERYVVATKAESVQVGNDAPPSDLDSTANGQNGVSPVTTHGTVSNTARLHPRKISADGQNGAFSRRIPGFSFQVGVSLGRGGLRSQ